MKRQMPDKMTQPKKIIKKAPGQVTAREILLLQDNPVSELNQKNRICIRIVQWSSNQSCEGKIILSPVTLEKRRYYLLKDGSKRWGKAMGFTIDDIKLIAQRQEDIIQALQ